MSDPEMQQYLSETSIAFSGLRRAISQVSMLVGKATSSGEVAWHEECQKYRQTRFSSRRVRKRVVFKHGDCNVVQGNVAKRRRRYLQDIFTTLVDAQWRWTLLVFAMTFLLSWLGFALVWWLVVYAHGDLDPKITDPSSNISFTPCVEDIHGFTSCFLFSVETQHTIGYGSKHTTEECPEAIFIMCIQSMTGVILQAFMVGIVFAKLSRPKKRTQTLLFSRNAVICQRDGQPCLMFRVGDMRKSHIIEAHVRAQMIKRKVTREGELLPFFQTELKVGGDGEEDKIFFIWPTTIVHKINQQSPLYHLSASDMLRERFEIIVLLEGVIESTGMTTQARSSYLPSEILWGHRFEHIITFRKEIGEYEVNYTLFNNTYEVDTPLCSAAELDHVKALHRAKGERTSSGTFAQYRMDSSSSLTSGSCSSFASSAGGLQMHTHAATPPTPIPVMITAPDDSPRRGSTSQPESRRKFATFYTLDETLETGQELIPPECPIEAMQEVPNTKEKEEEEEQNETLQNNAMTNHPDENAVVYDKTFEGINANLRFSRRSSLQGKPARRISREGTRVSIEDIIPRNTNTSNAQSFIGLMKKSPSHTALELRQTGQMACFGPSTRRSSLNENRKSKNELPKKASFQLTGSKELQEPHKTNCDRPKEQV
ncbi:PREDICTED: ATP-sensitive inward rectifier potassium channel 12-like isoform X2 [Ceratosolen solmsi marchali]|uniref:ATP-sensitive inward rectifier potassium channel 12-like isoform X2 n=1 Tax=Ceratosolen solmsi marchali TaxID=326594 RepID=A0AAJ7E0F6_9HYME|nr:PREDICTED: ATP-sensitive inward rectifier potassium channel 12-like isoform X2 [Ceratosolen solmsi marchali]